MTRYLPASFFLLFISGITAGAHPDHEEGVDGLLAADAAFLAAVQENGVDAAFEEFMAPLSVNLLAGDRARVGLGDILGGFEDWQPEWQLAWEAEGAGLADDGSLGFTWGRWQLSRANAEGADETDYGYYTTIWGRQPDGHWKVILDMTNVSPPPAGAVAGDDGDEG